MRAGAGWEEVCGVAPCCSCPPPPRVLTITAVSQLFLLGCTWILGLFLFDPKSQVLAYAFTILTCLQGFFLFLLHCLLNKKVGFRPSCRWASTSLPLLPLPWAAPPLT